ncbi:MAG: glycosyltransferase family 2 protein [Selenomonadaceae bacterium]|nr:glycosyltransferase family 2 protein [Selenomonadaceae bacterium]
METLFENEIALVVCVKNESPYIGEWLEYHHQIGVDKFYIYDNDSEDRAELQKILAPWIESNIVEYSEIPGSVVQITSYMDALEKHRFDCRYMGFLDADEFIVPKQNRELIDVIDEIFKLPPPPEQKLQDSESTGDVLDQMVRIAS